VASIKDARRLSQLEHGLATVATIRPDGLVQLTVVHAGIVAHPVNGNEVAAFVAFGGGRKPVHLRARPVATLLWRSKWSWVALEGHAELCGPDDRLDGVSSAGLRQLLREIAQASGVVPADWGEYDRLVAAERRSAVLITPSRIYQNP
jgi:hypothetical protein